MPTAKLTQKTGDVGGQKTLRTYWKNYFEKTDTLIWVVDGTDRERIDDCRQELEGLLLQEVKASTRSNADKWILIRTAAVDGSESARVQEQERCDRVHELGGDTQGLWFPRQPQWGSNVYPSTILTRRIHVGLATRHDSHAQVEHYGVQCIDWVEPSGGPQMGSARCQGPALLVLMRHEVMYRIFYRRDGRQLGADRT